MGLAGARPALRDPVRRLHILQGQSPEEIVESFPQLSMADVHAALAYYWDHRAEIEDEFHAAKEGYEEIKRANPSLLRQRMEGKAVSTGFARPDLVSRP